MNANAQSARPGRQPLDDIIAREELAEARVRRVAVLAWSITFGMALLLGIAVFGIMSGVAGNAMRAASMVIVITGILSFFLAVLTTIAWMSRSRAPTLAAIERRLAALESILLSRHDGV